MRIKATARVRTSFLVQDGDRIEDRTRTGSYEDFMTQKKKELYPPDEECNKPPNTTEGLAKAWEKILKEKKDKTQN
ncbi:uncharacterized protein LOC113682932 isoform X2 [Pocillopora damicornis]|uniref:uncharacterized protein LOC113682932 isoform X2 n=1 Tax=Pocillopora damicornis TaxID=46731 RepID=UPI000F553452|nr:uncharacterized protein LOC113682932 isoform X2 [Pocillopora damicornis]